MSKSLYAIGGMGIAACVLLSLAMKQLAGVKAEQQRDQMTVELAAVLGDRITADPITRRDTVGTEQHFVVGLQAAAGVDRRRIAEVAMQIAWRHWNGKPDRPHQVRVEVVEPGAEPLVISSTQQQAMVAPPSRRPVPKPGK